MGSRRGKLLKRGLILCFLLIVVFVGSRYAPQPLALVELLEEEYGHLGEFYSSQARLRRLLLSLGPYSSAVFILLQAGQVVVSPIPGELTGFVGGYVYGKDFGFVLSTLGLTLGSWVAFELARILGRPFVERLLSKRVLDRFRFLSSNTGALICFLLFVFPGFPKDSLSYALGLSRMRLSTFLIVSAIGRLPGTYLLSVQGASLWSQDYTTTAVVAAACATVLLFAYLCREHILRWMKRPVKAGVQPTGKNPDH